MQGNGFFFREFKCHLSSVSRNEQENMEECNFWKSLWARTYLPSSKEYA